MAMTKAEKARVEALETELAFRWPAAPEPQPMTREEIEERKEDMVLRARSVTRTRRATKGYKIAGDRIEAAWSDGHYHGFGHTGDGASQQMGQIYRTETEAWIALRWKMCRSFAEKLRWVDLMIEERQP